MGRFLVSLTLSSPAFSAWPVIPACLLFQNTPCAIYFVLTVLQSHRHLAWLAASLFSSHIRLSEEVSVAPRAPHHIPVCGSSAAFPKHAVLLCTSQIIFCCFALVIPAKSHSLSHHLCLSPVLSISQHFSSADFSLHFISSSLHLWVLLFQRHRCTFQSAFHYVSELVHKFSLFTYFLSRSFTYVLQAVGDGQEHLWVVCWAEESLPCPYPTKPTNNCISTMLGQS